MRGLAQFFACNTIDGPVCPGHLGLMSALMAAYGRLPVTMVRGEGAEMYDNKGRRYLDALGGIAVVALGHADPVFTDTVAKQLSTLLHCSNLYSIPAQEALGAELCRLAGMDKTFFCNSGAEANEACIKIARLHGHARGIENPTIIVMDTAFHGRTLATIAATGNTKIQKGFGPLTPGFVTAPFDDADSVEAIAEVRNDIVAVMVEPVQGESGIQVPQKGYLARLREICDARGWLLICDEIQSGMGRTGRWFAHQHDNIRPDVMSLAKALGNGVPIGACLARGAAAELIQPGSHGTTFGGNPFACSAGLVVTRELARRDLVARAGVLGTRMLDGFQAALHNRPGVVEIRGKGMMIGIELEQDCPELVTRALDAGLLINVTAGNVIRLLPPFILSDAQADEIVTGVTALIEKWLDETEPAGHATGDHSPATNGPLPTGAEA